MTGAVALVALLVASAAAVCAMLLALLSPARRHDVVLAAGASIALAPASLAWMYAAGLRLRPGEPASLYPLAIVVGCAMVAIVCAVPAMRAVRRAWQNDPAPRPPRSWVGFIVLTAACTIVVQLTLAVPLYENDALEYTAIARLIAGQRSIDLYPAVDSARTGGFYGPWTHPAGFPALLALAGSLRDTFDLRLMRVPSLVASLSILLLVGIAARGRTGVVAAAIMLGTPLFLVSTINTWVDPTRVAAGLAAIVVFMIGVSNHGSRGLGGAQVALGCALGLTFFMHSIGLVVIAMVLGFHVLLAPGSIPMRLAGAAIALLVALSLVAPDVAANMRNFGAVIADSPPLWRIPELGFRDWMLFARDLYYPGSKVLNGVFMGLTQQVFYGVSYFLAAAGWILMMVRMGRVFAWRLVLNPHRTFAEADDRTRWFIVASGAVLFWLVCSLAGLALGITEFIKNVRYPYTLQPLIALIAAIGLAPLFEPKVGDRAVTP